MISPKPRKPLQRKTPLRSRSLLKPSLRASIGKTVKPYRALKTRQRPVSPAEKELWSLMVKIVGCVACFIDGNPNHYCSIHHIDGRTKPDCHKQVLPLCAGHHQDGTGEDKTMIAVHPWVARFEARYGSQEDLLATVMNKLGVAKC
jgi:hypothetical protein